MRICVLKRHVRVNHCLNQLWENNHLLYSDKVQYANLAFCIETTCKPLFETIMGENHLLYSDELRYANLTLCIETTCKSLFATIMGKQPIIVFRRGAICVSDFVY